MFETIIESKNVDVLFFVEGSYPYVKGGVSSWIYEMIRNLSDFKFGIIFLGAYEGLYKEFIYPLPDNLVHLQILYLFEQESKEDAVSVTEVAGNPEMMVKIKKLHDIFKQSHGCPNGLSQPITDIGKMMETGDGFDYQQFLRSEEAWKFISEEYTKYNTEPSFIDYFWNIRNIHAPLWRLESIINHIPVTKILHSVSTGYSGLLSAMVHQRYNYPLMLSEHGLYSKERAIELLQSHMFSKIDGLVENKKTFNYQHQLWIYFFDSLARICYQYADPIISLFKAAQDQQHEMGADPDKTQIIPNGVDINKFAAARRPKDAQIPKVVCFVGRVVRIKDIKTFIRAVAIMIAKDAEITAIIKEVGNEDPEYRRECMDYINLMGLEDKIRFQKEGNMLDVLKSAGVLVLTSISEGMPLVLLESLAAGIPVITTSVGACREIIEGTSDDEDQSFGHCGAVVSIINAPMLAEHAVKLLNDPQLWHSASEAGIKRIEKYYSHHNMISSYRELYNKAIADGRNRN